MGDFVNFISFVINYFALSLNFSLGKIIRLLLSHVGLDVFPVITFYIYSDNQVWLLICVS